MKIHHIAIWTFQLEEMKEFYTRYFNGSSNEKYINPKKGFESYFLHFDEGTDLELMSRTDRQNGYVQRDIPSQESPVPPATDILKVSSSTRTVTV